MNPLNKGIRLKTGVDLFAKGFTPVQLNEAFYRLTADSKQAALLLECATFQEIDDEYNPGEEERLSTVEMIMEAVRVKAFSRTAQTMAALARAMNKQLAASGGGFTIGEAIIGKPKKSGLFATVTVQLPVSDGQVISIIFHSPDNNKMKITASDEILAFRWLLNKRDITAAVSPDGAEADTLPGMDAAQDVSLEDVGKRCAMLIEKNATRFASTQKEIVEAKKALEDLKAQADAETAANQQALADLKAEQDAAAQADIDIQAAQDKLKKIQDFNDKLQAQLDALVAANAGNAGKAGGEDTTGGETQAQKDAAEFEAKKQAFEGELTGRGFEDRQGRMYFGDNLSTMLLKNDKNYAVYVAWDGENAKAQNFESKTLSGLDKQIADALKWIDGKLGEMKSGGITDEDRYQAAAKVFESQVTDMGFSPVNGKEFRIGLVGSRNGKPAREEVSANYFVDSNGKVIVNANKKTFTAMTMATAQNAFDKAITALEEAIKDRETVAQWAAKYQGVVAKFNVGDEYKVSRRTVSPSFEINDYMEGYKVKDVNSAEHGGSLLPAIQLESDNSSMNIRYDQLQEYLDTKIIVPASTGDNQGGNQDDLNIEGAAITILNDIKNGKYKDSTIAGDKLDEAAATLERYGKMELYDELLNAAADALTELLKKEAA